MPIILIIGAIVIAIGFGVVFFFSPADPTPTDDTQLDPAAEMNIRVEDVEEMNDDTIKNNEPEAEPAAVTGTAGTYQASGEYLTPARTQHSVDVTLTLSDGIVTDSTVLFDGKTEGEYSNDNQARFADAYKAEVIGKPLGAISLARVGGASLTSRAFNEAVVKIATETTTEAAL